VVEHFRRDRCTRNEGNTEHRRVATDHQNFTKLHDRADITGDLANLKHIIWDDPELPAARFDDCEHRYIPSCSIPALGQVRAGFLFSRYGFIADAGGASRPRSRKNKRREIVRAGWVTYSRETSRVKANGPLNPPKSKGNQPIPGIFAISSHATIGFRSR
jgi:hypothetical protein